MLRPEVHRERWEERVDARIAEELHYLLRPRRKSAADGDTVLQDGIGSELGRGQESQQEQECGDGSTKGGAGSSVGPTNRRGWWRGGVWCVGEHFIEWGLNWISLRTGVSFLH